MYSWGDDTSTWKNPGSYNYGSARRTYMDADAKTAAAKGPRTYSKRNSPDSKLVSTVNKIIETQSENPIVIAVDVTGSMSTWPASIFDRLPLLYQTLANYKQDLEISFAAIGDATCDNYPLQVNGFAKGPALDDNLRALCAEGGGGGQHMESYELFGYYMNSSNVLVPKAKSPFLIIFGDEGFYENIHPDQVKHYIGHDIQSPMDSLAMWKSLSTKFDTYLLHKPYSDSLDKTIIAQWSDALGPQKIIQLYDEERAVDVAIGLIARRWGKYDDFSKNISARHDSTDISAVTKSLRFIGSPVTPNSMIPGSMPSRRSSRLDK
jgi:hypothetical protein